MDHFELRDGVLHAEGVPLPHIAEEVGTPVYIYSRATLERHARVFREALGALKDPHIAFAVKSNPNLAVLKILANEGYGADVVSGGELTRALAAGMKPEDIVFSGVGKTHAELLQGLEAMSLYINGSPVPESSPLGIGAEWSVWWERFGYYLLVAENLSGSCSDRHG